DGRVTLSRTDCRAWESFVLSDTGEWPTSSKVNSTEATFLELAPFLRAVARPPPAAVLPAPARRTTRWPRACRARDSTAGRIPASGGRGRDLARARSLAGRPQAGLRSAAGPAAR